MSVFARFRPPYRNKHFLSITLISFMTFLVFTSIVLGMSFYTYQADEKKKALSYHAGQLDSYTRQLNMQYDKIIFSAEQLAADARVLEWIHADDTDRNLYLSKQILDRLKYISVLNDAVYSLEVYNANSASVISQYYGYYGDHRHGFAPMDERRAAYTAFMDGSGIRQVAISSERINNAPVPTIVQISAVPTYKKSGAIGMVVQADRLMPQNIAPTENLFLVDSDQAGDYFAASANPHIPVHRIDEWSRTLLEREPSAGLQELTIEDTRYYAAYRNVVNGSLKLVMLVPEADLVVNLKSFSDYFRIALVIIFALSIFCSYLIYRVAHQPIRKMADTVSLRMNVPRKERRYNDDVVYLNQTFDMIISKNTEIERTLQEHEGFFKENMLRKLIYGSLDEEDTIFYAAQEFGEEPHHFIILLLNTDSRHRQQAALVFDRLDDLLLEDIRRHFGGRWMRTGYRQYTMLVNVRRPADRDRLLAHIRQRQERIREEHAATLTVGVSSIKRRIAEIADGFSEAQDALKYRTLLGNNRIIDSTKLPYPPEPSGSFSVQEGQLLIRKLRTAGEEEITGTLAKMIDEKASRYSIEMLNAFLLYISSCIVQVGMEYNISPDRMFDNNLLKAIAEYDTIEEMKQYLAAQCKAIVDVRNTEQRKYKKLSGEIAVKYIERHFNEPISLDIVASEINMSPSYLSRLIKQELGRNFNAYLNKLRIDKSVELLRDSDMTVKEVSAAVGYYNEHTFIRNFKSLMGKTPADYRQSELQGARPDK